MQRNATQLSAARRRHGRNSVVPPAPVRAEQLCGRVARCVPCSGGGASGFHLPSCKPTSEGLWQRNAKQVVAAVGMEQAAAAGRILLEYLCTMASDRAWGTAVSQSLPLPPIEMASAGAYGYSHAPHPAYPSYHPPPQQVHYGQSGAYQQVRQPRPRPPLAAALAPHPRIPDDRRACTGVRCIAS